LLLQLGLQLLLILNELGMSSLDRAHFRLKTYNNKNNNEARSIFVHNDVLPLWGGDGRGEDDDEKEDDDGKDYWRCRRTNREVCSSNPRPSR